MRYNHIKIAINHAVLCRQAMCDVARDYPTILKSKLLLSGNIINLLLLLRWDLFNLNLKKKASIQSVVSDWSTDCKQQNTRVRVEYISASLSLSLPRFKNDLFRTERVDLKHVKRFSIFKNTKLKIVYLII